ncbi:hypothetical protein F8M41_002238 [Gigaspora margarita]|uniref:Uncharacterized protein n=1 Tax=Gigaspora margarita TaxID=4874 RepID=A0A8H4AYX0_GIGMA|nr:hypothetical protein F8M41_002238 [Gigaspora margarita]
MGRTRKRGSSVSVSKKARSNSFDDNYSIPEPEAHLPSDDDYLSDNDFASENEVATHSKHKRKNDKVANEDTNMQKRIRFATTIRNMHEIQLQMVAKIYDMQKKIDAMYADWKSVGFGGDMRKDNKWIENAIGQLIYCIIEKVKYPNDERIMEAQRFARQARSNIVQCIKDTIHSEFSDLTKPKTENWQVSHDEERKFKDADITRECYTKLNKPVDINDDPHYTYLNLIIDCAFTDPATEKNSIAFGMAVALNYLDPTKGVNMVPSEVVERMNYFLEKMQVNEREEYE